MLQSMHAPQGGSFLQLTPVLRGALLGFWKPYELYVHMLEGLLLQ